MIRYPSITNEQNSSKTDDIFTACCERPASAGLTSPSTRKHLLGTRHSMLPKYVLFLLPDQLFYIVKNIYIQYIYIYICVCVCARVCVCTHTHTHAPDCVEIVYEIPLLSNNTASETFLHESGAVQSVDWIFIIRAPAWRWLDDYVTLGKTFYKRLLEQEVAAAAVTSTCSSLSHFSRRPLLEIWQNNYTIH